MAAYKTTTARLANGLRRTPGAPFWLRNYYEHIIRDEDDLLRIRAYIIANPQRWADDADAEPWRRP
jgi:REP element-mobilizing transposase RayT